MRIAHLDAHLEGKQLARSIIAADGRVLLKKGVCLTAAYLDLLRSKGYTSIYVENELLPGLDIDEAINETTRVQAVALVRQVLEGVRRGEAPELAKVGRVVDSILEDLAYHSETVWQLSTLRSVDEYSFVHSVNVCVLSLLMGVALHYPHRELHQLGVGAILHDLGKVRIPREYLQRPGPLSPEEYAQVQEHTTEGFEILRVSHELSILSAHVAFQHHERMNGSGYPRGLQGEDILPYARIAAVADVYDALVSDRPYRRRFPPDVALQEIRQGQGHLFDAACVLPLISRLAIYPVGTIVHLTSRQVGVVTQQGEQPEFPMVTVVTDRNLRLVPPYPLCLQEQAGPAISQVLPDYPPSVLEQVSSGPGALGDAPPQDNGARSPHRPG